MRAERSLVTVVAALVAFTGCVAESPGRESSTREPDPGDGTYWMIHVRGSQHEEPPPNDACDVRFDHAVHPDEEALTYAPHAYDLDPGSVHLVIAFDHVQERSDCPFAYALHVNESRVEQDMGAYGTLVIEVAEDGSVLVEGEDRVQPGQSREYAYEDTLSERRGTVQANGSFVVEHHGAWPVEKVRSGGPGAPA